MDYVHKLENRTLWGQGKDLKYKVGATTVIMRARPAGFGLQVPHVLHRVLSACGIRDASATIEGSRNPLNVLNAAIQILHGGVSRAPPTWSLLTTVRTSRLWIWRRPRRTHAGQEGRYALHQADRAGARSSWRRHWQARVKCIIIHSSFISDTKNMSTDYITVSNIYLLVP